MPDSESDEQDQPLDPDILERLSETDIDEWLDTLRRSDRSFYNLMALEVWSIAKTMDGLVPGFWSRFMANRRVSLQQFLKQREEGAENGTGDGNSGEMEKPEEQE